MDDRTTSILYKAHELIKAGRPYEDEALALLAPLVRENPESAEAWYLLGRALPDPEQKLYAFRRVLRIDPSNRAAQKQIAALTGTGVPARERPSGPPPRGSLLVLGIVMGIILMLIIVFGSLRWLAQPGGPLAAGLVPTETALINIPNSAQLGGPYSYLHPSHGL
jgi:hypothetical protein